MNTTVQPETHALLQVAPAQEFVPQLTTTAALILHGDGMDRIMRFAQTMARGAVTVPRHLQGNEADCLAVTLQATQWGLNPFAVAQKTHLSQSGALGYEAQLISAVITNHPAIQGDPEYVFYGDWDKILGKVEERKSDKGGKYYAATYSKADEEGLGCICKLTLRGESKPRELDVKMSQCYPRFSTQWATDPMQQITYVAIRKWARRFKPGIILGVLGDDEVEGPQPKFMGPADVVQPPTPPAPTEWPTDLFAERLPEWRKAIAAKRASVDSVVAKARTKYPLSADQEAAIRAPDADDAAPKVTYAQVAEKLIAAADMDQLAEAASLIAAAPEAQRAELTAIYERRGAELSSD